MSYQIISALIFMLTVLGLLVMLSRRLPEAGQNSGAPEGAPESVEDKLFSKGLPVAGSSKIKTWLFFWLHRLWHFVLEAKGLKPPAVVGYRIKKIFSRQKARWGNVNVERLQLTESILPLHSEAQYLEAIKREPKNLKHYSSLGQFYMAKQNFAEARDIYEYLLKHSPGDADFYARLGYSNYHLANYEQATANYQASISLDSTHPNRYYNLALALKVLNRLEESLAAIGKAIELEPDNVKYQISQAEVYNLRQAEQAKANREGQTPV